ncbi:MAG TPA: ABC transporter permease [Pyrinomonadaceae bacterium]|nr:ABC transporter permease [Pyrinomonadaceae bacterium]
MDLLIHDLRYAFRMMFKHRLFTCVAVLALGLGIGANTAIFSVINAVVLRPLPYGNPEQLVTVLHDKTVPVAPANYFDLAAQSQSFSGIAAAQWWEPNLTGHEQPEHLRGLQLTAQMFQVLGVSPLLGRTFNADEDQPGRERVVVLSHRLWQRRFGGDAGVVGQQVTFDGESYTIIGVMPAEFQFAPFWATKAELWSPLNLTERANDRGGQSLRVFARLRPGVTRAMAQAEVATIFRRLEQEHPETNKGLPIAVEPLHEQVVGKTRPALLILFGAVSFVLLIACANVANLMMARAASRQKEIALRTALGANSARIARQLLTESIVIALIGGAFGLLLSIAGMRALLALGPGSLPRLQTIALDLPTLAVTFGLSVITGLLFGLAPVLQTRKWNWYESLKESTRGSSAGRGRVNARRLLVITEVALALMLLVGGGLMVRSFARLRAVDPGFNPDQLLTMTISLAGSAENTGPKRVAFFNELLQRVDSLPGVQSASAINHLPLGGDVWTVPFLVEGRPAPAPGEKQSGVYRVIRPDYFRTMGATLLKGRDFTAHDNDTSPQVVIVNESFAKRHWPNEDPLGKRIRVSQDDYVPREIVGVVKALKQDQWTAEPNLEMYLPYLQAPAPRALTLVVRSSGDPLALVGAIENQVWSIDKNLPVAEIRTMQEVIAGSIEQHRFNLFLLGLFAFVALVLALVGIYGVMSEAVNARTHEIGIRMALGARAADVLRMVVGQGMALAVIGIVIGLFGAFWLTRFMSTLLYEVSPTDSVTFLLIPLVVALVVLCACLVPARRATKVDPLIALRDE